MPFEKDDKVGSDVTLPALVTPTPDRVSPGAAARRGPLNYQAGDLVAERYRIVRPIGEGGMGEVYEAEDLLLKERVALKTLRDPVADDETSVLRFKREIQLARRVTHPNVCRIFDVGLDRRGGRESAFLTMELLEGETLAAHLRRVGKLGVDAALPIAEQIAGALAAAHAAGIIHRDLKCANVLLVDGHGSHGGRAVVTDFGLARAAAEGGDQVTGDGGIVGSPAYMAPEQVEGGRRLTAAADLYAFGVVLYEMVTGRLPFVGDSPLATAVKRVKEAPPSPRTFVPDLDARWERTILHCLARVPEDRPANAHDVARSLRGEIQAPAPPAAAPPPPRAPNEDEAEPRRRLSRRTLALIAVGAIAVAAFGIHRARVQHEAASAKASDGSDEAASYDELPRPPRPPRPPGSLHVPPMPPMPPGVAKIVQSALDRVPELAGQRRSVAILGFKNLGGKKDYDYISGALTEMLATELMAGGEVRVVPGESVVRARRRLDLQAADSYAKDSLERLRLALDADVVVTGSYLVSGEGEQVRLDLRLQDTTTGEDLGSMSQNGDLDELADLASGAGEKMREELHVDQPSEDEREGARALLPRQSDVARLYAEGLAQMRVDNCGAARGPLEQAVAADANFALAHEALADVLYCLGYEGRAQEEAQRAVELSAKLPPEVRLQSEARLALLNGEWVKAKAVYAELFKRNPDNYDYGLRLLRLQVKDDPDGAKQTMARLRKLAPATDRPELDRFDIMLQGEMSVEKRLAALESARKGAEEQGARLVAASVLLDEVGPYLLLGRSDDAVEAARRAKEVFQASGDKDGIILSLASEGLIAHRRKDEAAVRRLLDQATRLAAQIDSVRSLTTFYLALGESDLHDGNLDGAETNLETALHLQQRTAHPHDYGRVLHGLAQASFARGSLRKVEAVLDTAEEMVRKLDDVEGLGEVTFARAQIALVAGDRERARALVTKAVETFPDLAKGGASAIIEAAIALDDGRADTAEPLVRKAVDDPRLKAISSIVERTVFDAALAQGKTSDARAVIDKIVQRGGKNPSLGDELTAAAMTARLRAASKKPADQAAAIADLTAVAARAAKAGYVFQSLEADLSRGRLERAAGRAAAARATLTHVAREAARLDLGRLAAQAERALTEG